MFLLFHWNSIKKKSISCLPRNISTHCTASSSCVSLATFAPNFSVYWWENSNNNIERRLIRRPHLYCNLFPVIWLPTPLLSFVSVNIAHESTVLVPQCCDGRAALTVTKDLKQTGEACATEFCYTCIFTCYFIFFSKKKKYEKNGSHLACTHLRGRVTAPRPNAVIVARMVGNWLSVNTLV